VPEEEESTRRSGRRPPPSRAAGDGAQAARAASQEAREAERTAEVAAAVAGQEAEIAGEALRRAQEAERGAEAAAQVAVAAVLEVGAEREAAHLSPPAILTPGQLQALITRLVEAVQKPPNGPPPPPNAPSNGAPPPANVLDAGQQSLVLKYDVFRTMLGRHGAASIALYRVVDGEYIEVKQRLAARSTVVAYGRPAGDLDQPTVEIGRAFYQDGRAAIPGLRASVIDRVEILDADHKPALFGRPDNWTPAGYQPHPDQE
jgi:hypothetical protein